MGDLNLNLNTAAGTAVPPTPLTPEGNPPAGNPVVTPSTKEEKYAGEIYMIPGVDNFTLSEFTFEGGMLVLPDRARVEQFEALWRANIHRGYAARIRKVDAATADLTTMKQKLMEAAVSGPESSEARPRSLPQI